MVNIRDKQLKYERALEYEIFVKGEYAFAKEKIQNAKCIFDIGGHIGLFSKWCRSLNSDAKIHYFEPVEEFVYQAKKILGEDKNITLNNYGIGPDVGKGILLLNQKKTMQSSKYPSFLNKNGIEISVNFITLKEYLNRVNLNKIDILKMDIEGMEFEVLSSRSDFERGKIDSLIIEIHLLNKKIEAQRSSILLKIRKNFGNIEIINSKYCKEIFLIRAQK